MTGTAAAAPAYCSATNLQNYAPDPYAPSNVFEQNLATIPSSGDTIGIPTATNTGTTGSVSSPATGTSFAAGFLEETELYQYLNNMTSSAGDANPDGSPGAYDSVTSGLESLPSGTVVPLGTPDGPSLPTTGPGLPYAAVYNVNANGTLGSQIAGDLPVTVTAQSYTPNTTAWQHSTYTQDSTFGQPVSTTCGGNNLFTALSFNAAGVPGLHPGTVYAAYLLVRDSDQSGPLSNHVWYFTPPAPQPKFYLGYVDSYPPRAPGSTPTPWQGSANPSGAGGDVIFEGCNYHSPDACAQTNGGDDYDGGAIRIDNPVGAAPLTVTGGQVSIGPALSGPYAGISCVYNPWQGLNVTVQPGQTLILTETGGPDPCGAAIGHQILDDPGDYNFDTSESANLMPADDLFGPPAVCVDNGLTPVVTLDIDGGTTTIDDTTQILTDGGVDRGGAPCAVNGVLQNEAEPWTAAGIVPPPPPPTPDNELIALEDQIATPGFVSNSGFEGNLANEVTQIQQQYDQGNTQQACQQLGNFDQQLFQQSAGSNPQIAAANAKVLLTSANGIANQIGCTGTTSAQQKVEASVFDAIASVGTLSPAPAAGTANGLEQNFAKVGQDLSQGGSNNNQNACHDLGQLVQQLFQWTTGNSPQITTAQGKQLAATANGFAGELGCSTPTSTQASVEASLFDAISTVAGLSPAPQAGTTNQLEQGFAQVGQDLSQANNNACHDLANQLQQIQGPDASQLTSSEAGTLSGLTTGFKSQLGC